MEETKRPLWLPDAPGFIAILLLLLFGVVIMLLMLVPIYVGEAVGTLLTALIGVLASKVTTIVDFHFGSSKTSKDKDDTIRSLASNGHTPPAPPP
jgi:hypothetical protein